jgi:phosphoglycolate phosphatase
MIDPALIVFDLDGTLVDSGLDLANAVNALIAELGRPALPEAAIISMVGDGAGVLIRRALTAASLDPETPGALERFLEHYGPHLLDNTRAYPGILDALEWIGRRFRIAVLTNKPGAATEVILDGLGLRRYFQDVIGGDSVHGRKPAPAGLSHLAANARVTPSRVLMVGDSPVDLATARNAGTQICLARYGFGYRFTSADFRGDELFIDSPMELIDALDGKKTEPRRPPTTGA